MEEKSVLDTYEQKRQWVRQFNLTSDLFAGKVFEDLAASQELCRILMQQPGLRLKSVRTQYVIRNLESHSVQLDILAEEDSGHMINVEFQMYSEDEPFRRTRYYTSCIDMSILEKGREYYDLPDVTVLYITKGDFIGCKTGVYQVDRKIRNNNQVIDAANGVHEKYFNLKYSSKDAEIDELLHYLKDSDPFYQTESFPRIVERVNLYKMQKKGVDVMCEIADRIRQEGKIEGKIEDIMELLEELGKIPIKIAQRIGQETNLNVLARWHRCAARASSISEFEAWMLEPERFTLGEQRNTRQFQSLQGT